MKKLYQESQMKKHLLQKSRSAQSRRNRHIDRIKPSSGLQRFRDSAIVIKAPSNFSFVNNPNEFINFLNCIQEATKVKRVFIDVGSITSLTTDAIYVLLCKINDENFTHHRDIQGNYPYNKDFQKIWFDSGFVKYVTRGFRFPENYGDNIQNHWSNDVKSDYTDKLINFATKTMFGEAFDCKGIQRAYVELMSNTVQHAKIGSEKDTWWTAVYCDKDKAKSCYTFVDSGIGIFQSAKMLGFKKSLSETLSIFSLDNLELIKDILRGRNISTTKISYRGQGLYSIGLVAQRNQLKNLVMISNDVYADISNKKFVRLEKPYAGTFFYWEYDNSCSK